MANTNGGGLIGRRRLAAAAAIAAAAALLPSCFWVQPGYGPEHTRDNPGERTLTVENVASLAPVWSVDVGTASASEPLISGGRVYVTGRDLDDARVRALRLSSGEVLWDRPVEVDSPMVLASPVTFSGDSLWLSHLDITASGCPTRLTRIDPGDGHVVSSEEARYPFSGPVTGAGVAVSVESDTCLDFEGGPATLVVDDATTRSTLWTAPLTGPAGITISDGIIFAGTSDQVSAYAAEGCGATVCAPLWVRNTTPPGVVAGGRMYSIIHTTADLGHGVTAQTAELRVSDVATGALLWSTGYIPGDPYSGMNTATIHGIAVADGTVYVTATRDPATPGPPIATLDAFPVTGCGGSSGWCAAAWTATLDDSPRSTIAVGGGVVYVGVGVSGDGSRVVGFDAAGCGTTTCAPLVSVPVDGAPDALSLAQGTLLATSTLSNSARLTAFRAG